jgi:hypothetical protein
MGSFVKCHNAALAQKMPQYISCFSLERAGPARIYNADVGHRREVTTWGTRMRPMSSRGFAPLDRIVSLLSAWLPPGRHQLPLPPDTQRALYNEVLSLFEQIGDKTKRDILQELYRQGELEARRRRNRLARLRGQ